MAYELKERTPNGMSCGLGPACPRVYEVTPKDMVCGVGPCPGIFTDEQNKDSYLIIGKVVDARQFGLEKKVGEGEILISVPKRLIDEMERGK